MDCGPGPFRIITGRVAEGRKLGRLLGFPTANIALAATDHPPLGVYATLSQLQDHRVFPGVANIGVNPTTGVVEPRLEVHLFDFDGDLYGQTLTTLLIGFLRPEAHLGDLKGLVDQMREDADHAREVLRRSGVRGLGGG